MKQLIKRSDLNEVVKWFQSPAGPRGNSARAETQQAGGAFLGVNTTAGAILPGDRVAVASFYPAGVSYSRALALLYGGRLKLSFTKTTRGARYAGTALTPATGKGRIIRAEFPGGFYTTALGAGAYLNADGTTTDDASEATAVILARTPPNEGGADSPRVVFANLLSELTLATVGKEAETVAKRVVDEKFDEESKIYAVEKVEYVQSLDVVDGEIVINYATREIVVKNG